jgi:hypothetical protein
LQNSTPFSEVDIRRTICNLTGCIFWDMGLKNVIGLCVENLAEVAAYILISTQSISIERNFKKLNVVHS